MSKLSKLKEVKVIINNIIVDLEIKVFLNKKNIKQKKQVIESKQ